MQCQFLIQHHHKVLHDYVDMGVLDLETALDTFSDFDWQKEYEGISKCTQKKLTVTSPGIILKNATTGVELSIYGRHNGDFDVYYEVQGKIGEDVVYADASMNKGGIVIHDYIIAFYQNELDTKFLLDYPTQKNIKTNTSEKDCLVLGKYNPWKYFYHPLVVIFAFVLLLICKITDSDCFIFMGIVSILILIVKIPAFILFYQYYSQPKLLSVSVLQSKILFNYAGRTVQIEKKNILQCVYTFCKEERLPWCSFANIVITLKDKSQHYITTLSLSKDELETLLEQIDLHYFKFDTIFQRINTKLCFNESEAKERNITSKDDLEIIYLDYTDEMLNEIIKNQEGYQPNAVEAAAQELNKRKKKQK